MLEVIIKSAIVHGGFFLEQKIARPPQNVR